MGLFTNLVADAKAEFAAIRSGTASTEVESVVTAIETSLLPKIEAGIEARMIPLTAQLLMRISPGLTAAAALVEAGTVLSDAEQLLPAGTTDPPAQPTPAAPATPAPANPAATTQAKS
jgi:hypothetical protein